MRECEGERARVRQRGRNLAPSPSHSRILEPRVFMLGGGVVFEEMGCLLLQIEPRVTLSFFNVKEVCMF